MVTAKSPKHTKTKLKKKVSSHNESFSWSRVLEKLTFTQLTKEVPTSYGIKMYLTAFTRAHHHTLC
jgi:hypothetical protein